MRINIVIVRYGKWSNIWWKLWRVQHWWIWDRSVIVVLLHTIPIIWCMSGHMMRMVWRNIFGGVWIMRMVWRRRDGEFWMIYWFRKKVCGGNWNYLTVKYGGLTFICGVILGGNTKFWLRRCKGGGVGGRALLLLWVGGTFTFSWGDRPEEVERLKFGFSAICDIFDSS